MKKEHGILWRAYLIRALLACLLFFVAGVRAVEALSPADYEAFGKRLEDHFNHADKLFYVNSFDLDAMASKTIPAELSDSVDPNEFKRGIRQAMEVQLSAMRNTKFLRVVNMDGESTVLMRTIMTNNTVNYVGLFLEHDARGVIRIKDAYAYLLGERITDSGRRLLIPVLEEKNKSALDRLFGDSPDLIKYRAQWEDLIFHVQRGQYVLAMDDYAQLPASLQGEKFVLLQELRAAQNANKQKYLEAMELWRKRYPNDASLDMMSIDYYFLTKQYDQALDAIDRVDKVVGGDPYQDFNRAMVYYVMKDLVNAEKFSTQAIQREPDLLTAGFVAIKLKLARHDYAGCIEILDEMNTKGGRPKSALDRGLRTSPIYAPLRQSDAYHKWYPDASGVDGIPTQMPMQGGTSSGG